MVSRRQARRKEKKKGKFKRTGEVLGPPKETITRKDLPPKRIISKTRTPKERRKREFEIGKERGFTRGEVRRGLAGKDIDRKRAREERRDIRKEKRDQLREEGKLPERGKGVAATLFEPQLPAGQKIIAEPVPFGI